MNRIIERRQCNSIKRSGSTNTMLVYLLLFVAFICALHCYCKYNKVTAAVRQLPLPKEDFLVGCAIELMTSPAEIFRLARVYGKRFNGIYGWWSTFIETVNVYSPEDIETVVSTTKHTEKSVIYKLLEAWLGEGLLVSKGPKWLHRRKILTPAFHFNILKRFVDVMEDSGELLTKTLSETKGEAVDVIPMMSEYTLSTICETAMGTKLNEESSNSGKIYKAAVHKLSQILAIRALSIYFILDFIFYSFPIGREFKKHLKTVTSFTQRIIKERKEFLKENGITVSDTIDEDKDIYLSGTKKRTAMLDLLISAEKEGVIDGPGIQEEVDTFMFEGHDTTAAGLNCCLVLLANHKDIQDKIVREIEGTFGDSSRHATIEDLNSMKYLECCIKESLRLYPPVPFIGRNLTEPVVLSGYKIPAGVPIHIHIYDLHRREDLYENAEVYDPDRFLPENCVGRHPYAYLPFSAGPRNCIGHRFAILEMKSCISSILRKFELHPVTKPEDFEFGADLVLRSTKPMYVKFIERTRK